MTVACRWWDSPGLAAPGAPERARCGCGHDRALTDAGATMSTFVLSCASTKHETEGPKLLRPIGEGSLYPTPLSCPSLPHPSIEPAPGPEVPRGEEALHAQVTRCITRTDTVVIQPKAAIRKWQALPEALRAPVVLCEYI